MSHGKRDVPVVTLYPGRKEYRHFTIWPNTDQTPYSRESAPLYREFMALHWDEGSMDHSLHVMSRSIIQGRL